MADVRDTIIAILIHVGADTSNLGYVGPHFNRAHTFRFLPMKEDYPTSNNPIYEALGLGDYVLSRDKRAPVHNDPQFNEEKGLFTYGENEIERSRLGKLKKGSIIFFVKQSSAIYPRILSTGNDLDSYANISEGQEEQVCYWFLRSCWNSPRCSEIVRSSKFQRRCIQDRRSE